MVDRLLLFRNRRKCFLIEFDVKIVTFGRTGWCAVDDTERSEFQIFSNEKMERILMVRKLQKFLVKMQSFDAFHSITFDTDTLP